jgi:chromosome segregation ATPase
MRKKKPAAEPNKGPAFKKTNIPKLESVANNLWGMVREHKDSLDASRWAAEITQALVDQEDAYLASIQYYEHQANEANKISRAARTKARKAEETISHLEATIETKAGRLQALKQQLDNAKAKSQRLADKYEPKKEAVDDAPA